MISVPKCAVIIVSAFIFISWGISRLTHYFEVDLEEENGIIKSASAPFPNGKKDNIFWFMQLSDIHISRFYDQGRPQDLKRFCTEYIEIFKPKLVLVTGDLTDAKHSNYMGSTQYKDEWLTYDMILRDTKVTEKTIWLDVRGNHDSFNVPSLLSTQNFHSQYSAKKSLSYKHTVKEPYGEYSFIALDACPDPGPKRPFNFFGMLTKSNLEVINIMAKDSIQSNMTVWFGHYPTSTIVSEPPGPRHAMRNGAAYLCGHLHTMAGLMPEMYAKQKAGNLELELGDWRDNRRYRLLAIDHDLLSFTDVTLDAWPVVLVTNPKHALFNMPKHEPSGRMLKSTHIRILAFSSAEIVSVEVYIDKSNIGQASHSEGPLYVLAWEPIHYKAGVHTVSVSVKDSKGREKVITQPFSLDLHQQLTFDLLPRLIIMSNLDLVFRVLFAWCLLVAVIPLVALRFYRQKLFVSNRFHGCILNSFHGFITGLHMVARTDFIYYSLIAFSLYVCFGPWFIGELLDGHIGICFAFGLYVDGTFVPASLTFTYAILQIILFNIPLTLYLGGCLKRQYISSAVQVTWLQYLWNEWVFFLIIIYQFSCAYQGFYLAYGGMAFILGPVRSWSIILAIILRRKALRLTKKDFESYKILNDVIGNGTSCHNSVTTCIDSVCSRNDVHS